MRLPLLLLLVVKVSYSTHSPQPPEAWNEERKTDLNLDIQQMLSEIFCKDVKITPYAKEETSGATALGQAPNLNYQQPLTYQSPLAVQIPQQTQIGQPIVSPQYIYQRRTEGSSHPNQQFNKFQAEENIPSKQSDYEQLLKRNHQTVYQQTPQHFHNNNQEQPPITSHKQQCQGSENGNKNNYLIQQQLKQLQQQKEKYLRLQQWMLLKQQQQEQLKQQQEQLQQQQEQLKQQQEQLQQQQEQLKQQQEMQQQQHQHHKRSHPQQPNNLYPHENYQQILQQYYANKHDPRHGNENNNVQRSPIPQNTHQPHERVVAERDENNQKRSILHYVPQNTLPHGQKHPVYPAPPGYVSPPTLQGAAPYLYQEGSQLSRLTPKPGSIPTPGNHQYGVYPSHQRPGQYQLNDEKSRQPYFYSGEPRRFFQHPAPSAAPAEEAREVERPAEEPQQRTFRHVMTDGIRVIRNPSNCAPY